MKNPRTYTYTVRWSQEDQAWVATTTEMPSLSWLDADPGKAVQRLYNLVRRGIRDETAEDEHPVRE